MKLTGNRTITRHGEGGPFHCPACRVERESQVVLRQQFFTLFGLPLFAQGETRQRVRCRACGGDFPVQALSRRLRKIR